MYTPALSCALILFGISAVATPAVGSGFKLHGAHPLFGKCTTDDLQEQSTASGISFLHVGSASPSEDECMHMLAQDDFIFSSAVNSETTMMNAEADWSINETTPVDEVISRTKELLSSRGLAQSVVRNVIMGKIRSFLEAGASGSTIFVLGLGPELYALSKMSKSVIALEIDAEFCKQFFQSQAGACAMQANVHIYCTRPVSSEGTGKGGSELGSSSIGKGWVESFSGLQAGESRSSKELLGAAKRLLEDLIKQQFGDVPLSVLVVLRSFPVAKLLMVERYVDQSTVILSRSRVTFDGLAAISGVMRVLAQFDNIHPENPHSRLFSFTQQGDRWADYTTSQWEAKDDTAPLQLLDTVRQAVSSVQSAKNVSQAKQDAMDIYFNAFDHTLRRGTDKEWQHIMEFLQSLEASAENEEDFDDILTKAGEFAMKTARSVASQPGLEEYVTLLEETLANLADDEKVKAHASVCELVVRAASLIASATALEKAKDDIEDACELAETTPKLFFSALRIVTTGMLAATFMRNAPQVLSTMKKLGSEAALSA